MFLISENKNTEYLTPKQWFCKRYKVYEDYIEFDTEQAENKNGQKDKKLNFPKVNVEKAGLYKPLLNKVMTTHEQHVKYNFIAPLNIISGYFLA